MHSRQCERPVLWQLYHTEGPCCLFETDCVHMQKFIPLRFLDLITAWKALGRWLAYIMLQTYWMYIFKMRPQSMVCCLSNEPLHLVCSGMKLELFTKLESYRFTIPSWSATHPDYQFYGKIGSSSLLYLWIKEPCFWPTPDLNILCTLCWLCFFRQTPQQSIGHHQANF